MPDGLYERDALLWSEQQAGLLRRLAAGERVNDAVDWVNVIEELHDVGLSQLKAVRSSLRQALVHLLKLHRWPESESAGHWRDEVIAFLTDARDRFSPSMRQRIDLDGLFAEAAYRVGQATDGSGEARRLPAGNPFTLEELLAERPDVAGLMGRVAMGG